jgi:hypothetical protein
LTEIWIYGNLALLKTTLEIPDQLFREAKVKAAMEGRRLTDLITEGLQLVLKKPQMPARRIKFPIIKSKRKTPLEIPDDIAARMEIIDDRQRNETSLR